MYSVQVTVLVAHDIEVRACNACGCLSIILRFVIPLCAVPS